MNEHKTGGGFFACSALLGALLLAGCTKSDFVAPKVDQCLRREIFEGCMKLLPAGPQSTQYNDWSEVVEECESAAYYQALRRPELILPACAT